MFTDAPARFKARATRPPPHAAHMWTEALEQAQAGWMDSPRILNSSGRFGDAPSFPINNAFRFAVVQGAKIRACDDLRASETNRSCKAIAPISLPSWEHVAQISNDLLKSGRGLAFGKADESDAYKKLPLKAPDAFLAVITLQGPDGKWYVFTPRSQLFGSTAAVVHYNTFPRLLAPLFTRLFGIPLIGFFDDYGFLIFKSVMEESLSTFRQFCSILGIDLSEKKCSVGTTNTFLGLKGVSPSKVNSCSLTISMGPEKSAKWSELIVDYLAKGSIDRKSLDKLIGRFAFALTNIFGKFARSMISPLYLMLQERPFNASISAQIRENLIWWGLMIRTGSSRKVVIHPSYPQYVVYTDASWSFKKNRGGIAAILFDDKSGKILRTLSSPAPLKIVELFDESSAIYGLELFALVSCFAVWQDILAGCQTTAYVDNDPSSNGLIRGAAKFPAAQKFIMRFWQLIYLKNMRVWFL